jgi:2-iminobutanoate/2-iminopropanoate deaminase
MDKKSVTSQNAPAVIGPYSVAIRAGSLIFVSGQLGFNPATEALVPGGIEAETRQAMTNLGRILVDAGSGMEWIVKTTVFMKDLADFAKMNAIYAGFFSVDPPARSTVQVAALPRGAVIEVEAVAILAGKE